MKKFIIILILFDIFILTKCNNRIEKKDKQYLKENAYNSEIIKQELTKRSKKKLVKVKNVKLPDSLYRPKGYYYNNNIFFIDKSSNLLYKVSIKSGKTIIFGKGKGRGPGEFIGCQKISFCDSSLFILAPTKGSIVQYSVSGNYIKDINLEGSGFTSFTAIKIKDGIRFLLSQATNIIYPFAVYNIHGEKLYRAGIPLINKNISYSNKNHFLYHEIINLSKISDNKIIAISLRLGIVGYYNYKGEILFIKETIDGKKDPQINISNLFENYYFTGGKFSANKNYILNCTKKKNDEKIEIKYDIYNLHNFRYLYSLDLPEYLKFEGILLTESYLVTYNSDKMTYWKLPKS